MSGLARLLIWAIAVMATSGGAADAQLGGTMLARQARVITAVAHPMLTGSGQGLTFNGSGGTQ